MAGTSDFVKKVAESAKDLADTVKDKAEDAIEILSEQGEKLKDKAGDAFEAVSEKGDELKDKASDALRDRTNRSLGLVTELNEMIGAGKMSEAFEKYYAEDVVMVELGEEPRVGKAANRKAHEEWRAMVKEMHGGGTTNIASNESTGVTMIESWVDVTFQDGNRTRWEQVAVQQWKDGLIVHEKFYHK